VDACGRTAPLISAESVVAGPRSVYQRSAELARLEAQEAFERLAPDITLAHADCDLRLGQPAAEPAHLARYPVIVVSDRDDAEMHARPHGTAAERQRSSRS
jgi:hypothetical protein